MGFICRIENWMFWTSTKRAYRTAPTRIVPFAVACAMLDVWSTTASKSGSVPMYLEDIIRRYWTLCALPWQFPIFCRCPNLRKLISRWLTTKLFILPRTEEQLVTDLLRLVDNWSYFDFWFSALGIADKVGTIQVGKYFDALVIDLAQADGNLDLWPNESHTDLISKWIHLGDDRSISQVYVAGIEVKQAAKKVLTEKRMA